jgi:hypothetical protein
VEEFFAAILWLVVELVLIGTGRVVIWSISLGRWRSEAFAEKESKIHAPAGALSFTRDGRRVFTSTGLLFAGIGFYVLLVVFFILYAAKV